MDATSPVSGGRPLAVVLAVALVSLAVVGLAVGVQEAGDVEITRDGTDVEVRIDATEIGENATVAVAVGDREARTAEEGDSDGGNRVFEVAIADLDYPEGDLSNARVHALVDGDEVANATLDIRVLQFGSRDDVAVENGAIRLPVNEEKTIGFASGSEVTVEVSVGGDTHTYDATVEAEADELVLVPGQAAIEDWLDDPGAVSYSVEPVDGVEVGTNSLKNVDLKRAATTTVEPAEGGVRVSNPLLVADRTYGLTLVAGDGTRFSRTYRVETAGRIDVEQPALLGADELIVRVTHGGERIVEDDASLQVQPASATLADGGTTISFDDPLDLDSVEAVWLEATLDGEPTHVQLTNVSLDGATLDLSGAAYQLQANDSYAFVVTDGESVVAGGIDGSTDGNAVVAAGDGDDPPGGSDSGDGSLGLRSGSLIEYVVLAGAFLLAVVVIAFLGLGSSRSSSSATASNGGSSSKPRVHDRSAGPARTSTTNVTVRIRDEVTGEPASTAVRARRTHGGAEATEQAPDGQCTITLDSGEWKFETSGPATGRRISVPVEDSVELVVPALALQLTMVDDRNDDPVAGAEVTCEPDVGDPASARTGSDGTATVELSGQAEETTVSVEHDRYEPRTATVALSGQRTQETVALSHRTGTVRATVTVDGTPVTDAPVELAPADGRSRGERDRQRTDRSGTAEFSAVPVGEYEVAFAPTESGSSFRSASSHVAVEDGTTEVTLASSFRYTLDADQRDRIASMREAVDSLSSTRAGVDVAIRYYYGTAVASLLDAIERLPDQGHRFAATTVGPDELVEALLAAAESALDGLQNALSTKRNVDLFAACAAMPEARVDWSGEFSTADLFDWLADDPVAQRRRLTERLESVDERIESERPDFAVVSPARDPWSAIRDLVRGDRGDDRVESAALGFVAVGLLDAVADLFDEPALRERMERTVF